MGCKPNGQVRICADFYTGLNEALKPNHNPLPMPEEIFTQIKGSTVFSMIVLSDAYLQFEVNEDSKKLLTINTHRGMIRFNRLAPVVKLAPGAFQRAVDGMIVGIPGVHYTRTASSNGPAAEKGREMAMDSGMPEIFRPVQDDASNNSAADAIVVAADASITGILAVIFHQLPDSRMKVV